MAGTERVGLKTKSSGGQAGLNLSSGMSLSVENPQSRITPLPRPAHRRRPQEAENEVTKRNVDLKMKRHRDGVYPVSRLTTDPSFPRCVYSPSNHAESVKAQHPWCAGAAWPGEARCYLERKGRETEARCEQRRQIFVWWGGNVRCGAAVARPQVCTHIHVGCGW